MRECDLKGLLPAIVYIDLVGMDEQGARNDLLAGVRRGRQKPAEAPAFPGKAAAPQKPPRFPGALPDIWNVPHLRNPNFTGRAKLLTDMRVALLSGRAAALTQAITGLGGVGKTQLAIEYAYRYATDYSLVWWVRSEDTVTLTGDYADLAVKLDLPERDAADRGPAVNAVRRWLEHQRDWLLIFDNAGDPAECRSYLPRANTGHVLVTSRNPNWRGVAEPLPVKVLPRQEAIAFLTKRTGQDHPQAANDLCEAVADLPLALEQAGAYIDATGIAIAEYLARFRKSAKRLLETRSPSAEYPDPVWTTWQVAFEQIATEAPAALDLLNLLAFLAPDDIPRDLIEQGRDLAPKRLSECLADPVSFDAAVAALGRYSLIETGDGAFTVHRLVQTVTRDGLAFQKAQGIWAEAAVRIVNRGFPSNAMMSRRGLYQPGCCHTHWRPPAMRRRWELLWRLRPGCSIRLACIFMDERS